MPRGFVTEYVFLFCLIVVHSYPVFFLSDIFIFDRTPGNTDPEVSENATQIIMNYGFHVEEHYVTTADGYILCLIRMQNLGVEPKRKVVFLQHGLLDSAHTWINNLRNESLGFILADAGYDVWLGNSRGSTYSRRHETYRTWDIKYWEFSWDQMAEFDLPTSLYHVLEATGAERLTYIGHSQGTQIAFAQFNQDPELQKRISLFIALAPVAFLGSVESPIRYIAPFATTIERVWDLFGHGEFLPSTNLIRFLAHFLCDRGHVPFVCSNIIYLMTGFNEKNTNKTRLPVYVSHTPAGTSAQNIVHYCQGMLSDEFQRFDYGTERNKIVYGQETPPKYNLSRITIPTAVFSGGNDWLSVRQDVDRIVTQMKHTIISHKFYPSYNHLDFLWGMDAPIILYPHLLKLLNRY